MKHLGPPRLPPPAAAARQATISNEIPRGARGNAESRSSLSPAPTTPNRNYRPGHPMSSTTSSSHSTGQRSRRGSLRAKIASQASLIWSPMVISICCMSSRPFNGVGWHAPCSSTREDRSRERPGALVHGGEHDRARSSRCKASACPRRRNSRPLTVLRIADLPLRRYWTTSSSSI